MIAPAHAEHQIVGEDAVVRDGIRKTVRFLVRRRDGTLPQGIELMVDDLYAVTQKCVAASSAVWAMFPGKS